MQLKSIDRHKPLNARQEQFCQNLIKGNQGRPMNQTSAYIKAGYSPKGARGAASKLRASPKVAARVREIQEATCELYRLRTEAQHLQATNKILAKVWRG